MHKQVRDWWADEELEFIRYGGAGVHTRTCTLVVNRMHALLSEKDPNSVNWPIFLTKQEAESRHDYRPCRWCEPEFKRKPAQPPKPPWDGMSAVRRAVDEAARRQGVSRWDIVTRLAGETWADG